MSFECECHLFNNSGYSDNSSNNENEANPFQLDLIVSPQPPSGFQEIIQDKLNGVNNNYNDVQNQMEEESINENPFQFNPYVSAQSPSNFPENIQGNLNGVNNNNNDVQNQMKEESINKLTDGGQEQNDLNNSIYSELDLFKNNPKFNAPEKKEIYLENISETDNIDPFVEDTPKSYDDFVQEIKMMLKNLKNNISEDNEYLICNINDELLIQNAKLNDSSLFFDFDNTNNNKKKDNNEDIKKSEYKKDDYFENFYEEKKQSSKEMNELFELNCENNSFQQMEKSINCKIKGKSNCIFKTQIMQKSGEEIISMEKNENSLHLSLHKKSNKKEQKAKNDNKSEKKKGNIFFKIQNIESSNKNESEDYTKKNFDKGNNSCLIGCKNKKEAQCSQISKNTSSQTNITTSKESISINILNFSKNNISAPSSENSLSNINLNNMTFSGFSHQNNNNVNNSYELNRTVDNNLCNKKRNREKDKIIDMKNNSCENINIKSININNSKYFLENSIIYNRINNTIIPKSKNNLNNSEIPKIENLENKNDNKTLDETIIKSKTERILKEINRNKKGKRIRRIYDDAKKSFRRFKKYLLNLLKKKEISNLDADFRKKFFEKPIKSYSHTFMHEFFSKDCIVQLYKEYLFDKYNKNNLKENNEKLEENKKDEKNENDPYKLCRNNLHIIYIDKYNVNDLDFKKHG